MADRRPARPGQSARPQEALRCRVRLADGRVFCGELPAWRHRALQLGMLHAQSEGLVELTPGTRPPGGKVKINRRTDARHYLPGGAGGTDGRWLERLLEHAERIVSGEYAFERFDGGPREEAFVGVAPRTGPHGNKDAVAHTRFLWLDVDKPDRLPALWDFLAERPCQLLCESAGSGGVHCYWKLSEPLPAERLDERTGEVVEPIERANLRLIHALGSDPDGTPNVADRQCANRDRVMRLCGSPNHKRGEWARIIEADFALEPYRVAALVGDLPDPDARRVRAQADRRARGRGPVPADPGGRVHGPDRRTRAGPRRVRALPQPCAPGPQPVVLGPRAAPGAVELPGVRGGRLDLRPRVAGARRSVGPRSAQRRRVPARPRVRARHLRRADMTNHTTGEGARTMSRRNGRVTRLRPPSDVEEELMGAADAIADMAQRVQLNGPEPTYASEKLAYALFKAAEGLALCDVELAEVTDEARRGHDHGRWVKEDAQ